MEEQNDESKILKETENMLLMQEDDDIVIDLSSRGITLTLEKEEIAELKNLLSEM
jgi:hypothetical protein